MKQKSEVFQKFKKRKTLVKNQTGWKMKVLRSNNIGEYTSKEFKNYLASKGIKHQLLALKKDKLSDSFPTGLNDV